MPPSTSAESIVLAARQLIIERGPGTLSLSAVASTAGVSRPTLYRWFPTKDDLLEAVRQHEKHRFETGLQAVIDAERAPERRLEAALRHLVTYLDDEAMGRDPVGVDPAFALRALNDGLTARVDSMVRSLGDAVQSVPAVQTGAITGYEAVEVFVRLAFSHILLPHRDSERLLTTMLAFAGIRSRREARPTAPRTGRSGARAGEKVTVRAQRRAGSREEQDA